MKPGALPSKGSVAFIIGSGPAAVRYFAPPVYLVTLSAVM
jgi:hypothetical protein